ncbi:MAG: sterol carrier family protein [Mycobacteriaceae bacterium]|uniref:sterol carrier family protein n=1 Tax=Corynebacterium sp. TaxID=1720 RepID=UPI003F9A6367
MTDSSPDPAALRTAFLDVWPWVVDPDATDRPSRRAVATAVRLSVAQLGEDAPGHSVEVRVPPFAAVQCVEGSVHRRGTPPNVVQCDALTWLRLAGGVIDLDGAVAAGAEVSGAHAGDVSHWLPVIAVSGGGAR